MAQCQYFIKTKQAFCKFPPVNGTCYCSTHQTGRPYCPVDSSHSVKDIWKHIKSCPRIRDACGEALQPFYTPNYVLGGVSEQLPDTSSPPKSDEEILQIVQAIMPPWLAKIDVNRRPGTKEERRNAEPVLKDPHTGRPLVVDAEVEASVKQALSPLLNSVPLKLEEAMRFDEIWQDDPDTLREGLRRLLEVYGTADTCPAALKKEFKKFKHELQAVEMLSRLKEHVGSDRFRQLLCHGDWIEMGAGAGGLMKTVMTFSDLCRSNGLKRERTETPLFVLVERERRQLKAEKKDERATEVHLEECIRINLDITDFDLLALMQRQTGSPGYPWPFRLLRALGYREAAVKSLDEVPSVLTRFANVEHSKIDQLKEVFNKRKNDQLCNRPVIIMAKHLCGVASDLALDSIRVTMDAADLKNRPMYVVLAPCCYHRCQEDTLVEVKQLLLQSKNAVVQVMADNLLRVVGWSTAASGQKQLIGAWIKDAIASSRLKRSPLFAGLQLQRFTTLEHTRENSLIVGTVATNV